MDRKANPDRSLALMKSSSTQWLKRIFPHLLIWFLVVSFFLFGQSLVSGLVNREGKPVLRNIYLPAESLQVRYHIDKFRQIDDNGHVFSVQGWAFTSESPERPSNGYSTQVVLVKGRQNMVMATTAEERGDVVRFFEDLNLNIVDPGFTAVINRDLLPIGNYAVGILLTDTQDGSMEFVLTEHFIERTPNTISLISSQGN